MKKYNQYIKANRKEKTFKPVKLEIVIENEAELQSLWHRLNMSVNELIITKAKNIFKIPAAINTSNTYKVWQELEKIAQEQNLRNKRN